jgi:hypothetical protein
MLLLENNKIKIISDYSDGKTATQLAKEFGVNHWSITNLLKKNNIKIRNCNDLRIKYNELFFETESDELYYFWGFILGDGSLSITKGRAACITITLQESDISILEKFCNWLHIDISNIKHYTQKKNGRTYCRLCIFSDNIKSNLSKYGIVKRKTYNAIIPNIPQKYIIPFILGLLDADGHISFIPNKKYEIEIVGHPLIMDWYVSQITSLGYDGDIKYQYPKNKWKRVRVRRKNDAINLMKLLNVTKYYHLLLERKWKNANDFLSNKLIIIDNRYKTPHIMKL